MSDMYTDEELVSLSREDGPETDKEKYIGALISRYMRVITARAKAMRSDRVDADDLASEGLLGLLSAIRSYEQEKGSFSAYAGVCIGNRMKNARKSQSLSLQSLDEFDFTSILDEKPLTEELIIEREEDESFNRRLSALLSRTELEVLTLYLDAYSYQQIAARLEISVKSVDNALSRSRSKLRTLYRSRLDDKNGSNGKRPLL